jgi:hypothetical protein
MNPAVTGFFAVPIMVRSKGIRTQYLKRGHTLKVLQITFSIGRAMPLQPISGRRDDEYANIKPHASCTIAFEDNDCTQITDENMPQLHELLERAYTTAANTCFEQLATFSKEFRELYKEEVKA